MNYANLSYIEGRQKIKVPFTFSHVSCMNFYKHKNTIKKTPKQNKKQKGLTILKESKLVWSSVKMDN